MALTEKEKQLVEYGKKTGKTDFEIMRAIGNLRSEPKEGIFKRILTDIPNDLSEAFKGAVDSTVKGFETADTARSQVESFEISPLAGTLKTIGGGLRAGTEVV